MMSNLYDSQYYQLLNQLDGMYKVIGIKKIDEPCANGEHLFGCDCPVGQLAPMGWCIYCGIEGRVFITTDSEITAGDVAK